MPLIAQDPYQNGYPRGALGGRGYRAPKIAAPRGHPRADIGAYSGTSHLVVPGHLHAIGTVVDPAIWDAPVAGRSGTCATPAQQVQPPGVAALLPPS